MTILLPSLSKHGKSAKCGVGSLKLTQQERSTVIWYEDEDHILHSSFNSGMIQHGPPGTACNGILLFCCFAVKFMPESNPAGGPAPATGAMDTKPSA